MQGKRRNKITLQSTPAVKPTVVATAKPERAIINATTRERFARAMLASDENSPAWERVNVDVDQHEVHDTIRLLDTYPLDELSRYSHITGDQHRAGERLFNDWTEAGLGNIRVTDTTKEFVDSSPTHQVADRKLDALQRVNRVMSKLRSQHHNPLTDMVCLGVSLFEYGQQRTGSADQKFCRRFALTILREALTALDLAYNGPRKGIRSKGIAPDYRPSLMPDEGDGY